MAQSCFSVQFYYNCSVVNVEQRGKNELHAALTCLCVWVAFNGDFWGLHAACGFVVNTSLLFSFPCGLLFWGLTTRKQKTKNTPLINGKPAPNMLPHSFNHLEQWQDLNNSRIKLKTEQQKLKKNNNFVLTGKNHLPNSHVSRETGAHGECVCVDLLCCIHDGVIEGGSTVSHAAGWLQ